MNRKPGLGRARILNRPRQSEEIDRQRQSEEIDQVKKFY